MRYANLRYIYFTYLLTSFFCRTMYRAAIRANNAEHGLEFCSEILPLKKSCSSCDQGQAWSAGDN